MAADVEENRTPTGRGSENRFSTVSVRMRRKIPDGHWRLWFIYLQCYFLTIATILGTGILGLPVTIAHAGLLPFFISFIAGFFAQALLIYLFVELLQRAQVVQLDHLKTGVMEGIVMDQVALDDPIPNEEEEDEIVEAETGLLQQDGVALQVQAEDLQPNLHMLGHLFLSWPMSCAFNCILLFQFVSIGISYVLAGSEAYAALIRVSCISVIPAFTWILSLLILLAQMIIQPITAFLTLLKGILLIVTVAVTFALGSEVGLQSSSDFSQMGKPFLMGTVALGGIVNVMPFLYSQISHNKTQILWFRRAVLGGLTTCTLLNILWCWAVLHIVPQMSSPDAVLPSGSVFDPETSVSPLLFSNVSLEESERAGEIATIPLTKIITERYRSYSWVAELIQVFIAISVTVSFLVMGSAMKHTVDGLVTVMWSSRRASLCLTCERHLTNIQHLCSAQSAVGGLMSLLGFVIIFVVSLCDPKGFVVMLDKVVSFCLNTEAGLFVFLMLRESRAQRYRHLSVPLPADDRVFSLTWLLPFYFLFAVLYDVIQTVSEAAPYLPLYSHRQPMHNHSHMGNSGESALVLL